MYFEESDLKVDESKEMQRIALKFIQDQGKIEEFKSQFPVNVSEHVAKNPPKPVRALPVRSKNMLWPSFIV